uniref:Uncharacterized protein n=1 Tax=Arundo donax TaxID=35708 RepID=A0A0A9CBJ9_ARUDO
MYERMRRANVCPSCETLTLLLHSARAGLFNKARSCIPLH